MPLIVAFVGSLPDSFGDSSESSFVGSSGSLGSFGPFA